MKRLLHLVQRKSAVLIAITLLAGALFKLSAFAREAFITAHFGLTLVTDTYFSLQQLPLTLATFMFGAFSRAFTPAYAESLHEDRRALWLPGLLLYSSGLSLLLTAATLLLAPAIFGLFARTADVQNFRSLAILCASYLPIVWIGFCSAIWMSYGRSLGSMTLTGLPYLVMTLSLIGIYLGGSLGDLSLPISMTVGFLVVGACGLFAVLYGEKPFHAAINLLAPWRFAQFRKFSHQLVHSSVETIGYSASQFAMLYFLARAGTGAISANNCATRIGMLGFSLLAQPLTQFMQARMCTHRDGDRQRLVTNYLLGMGLSTLLLALAIFLFRYPVVQFIYMRGHFSHTALNEVAEMLPAWLGYFIVLSMNAVAARYLFTVSQGSRYTRNMLGGYILTNCLRFSVAGSMPAPWIVWCGVVGEGCAFLFNLSACSKRPLVRLPMVAAASAQGLRG